MVANLHEKSLGDGQRVLNTPIGNMPVRALAGSPRPEAEESDPNIVSSLGSHPVLARNLARALELSAKARAGVERAMFVRPAGGKGTASGDFCDAFSLDNGALALIVGDICGQGARSAAHVPEVRAMLRLALYGDPDPATALDCINAALCEDISERAPFVCASIAILQPKSGTGVFAGAGMHPPMIVSTTAMHRSVKVGGPPLGIFKETRYAGAQRALSHKDVLIMGTNGIFDIGGPYRPLGAERLLKWANGLVPLHSLCAIGQMLMDEVESYARGSITDDCALLLARLI